MQETQVRSLHLEDPLEKGNATHSSILVWRIPWKEKPGDLQSMGSQRAGHDLVTRHSTAHTLLVFKRSMLVLNKHPLVPMRVNVNTIYMFIIYITWFDLYNLVFSIKIIQECSKWAGNIMAINFYNFLVNIAIRCIDKYIISKISLQDCLQMPYIHQ